MRLIDAEKLIERINGTGYVEQIKSNLQFMVDMQPTIDAVEVVRCKDCKFGVYEKGRGIYHTRCEILEFLFQDDDYCSYGERKKE